MKIIPLAFGLAAMVDDADYPELSKFKWHVHRGKYTFYARKTKHKNNGDIFMHRMILKAKPGEICDHRNGNGLDNRRQNLRIATISQSLANRRTRNDSKSGRKGVRKAYGKWRAEIWVETKRIHLGRFKTEDGAAKAYADAATKFFGEFGRV
jgi:hypothetical protein